MPSSRRVPHEPGMYASVETMTRPVRGPGGRVQTFVCATREAAIDAHNASAARPYVLSMSLGFAQFDPFVPITLDALMAESDTNLYEAKRRRAAVREMMA